MVWDSRPPERRGDGRVRQGAGGRYAAMAHDERFLLLRSRFRRLASAIVASFLGWYLLYVLLSAFARGLMAQPLIGNINVALVLGVLQFVSTFALAWCYAFYARKTLDPLSAELRAEADRVPYALPPQRAPRDAEVRPERGLGTTGNAAERPREGERGQGAWPGAVRPDPGWLQ
ncbi:DUF485 domain-containing protein [Spirillospora sp. CA-253888]